MRFYSALLWLYPASFRAEYGAEMLGIFAKRHASSGSVAGMISVALDIIAEVVVNAARVHWDILRQDLLYAARTLARSPGFAITAILVTALGIGANTAAFSVADFVLLRPLPYPDADQLVKVWQSSKDRTGTNDVAPAEYKEWSTQSKSFVSMAAYYDVPVNLVSDGEPQRVDHSAVMASLFPTLGVRPLRGRSFTDDDNRTASSAIIISYNLWQSQFGGSESIVGRKLSVNGIPRVVIGVMPRDFHFPSQSVAIWTPITAQEANDDDVTNTYWRAIGRLKPGMTVERATAELDGIQTRLQQRFPDRLDEGLASLVNPLRNEFARQSRVLLLALCGAAGCVLLIACANLANLLLARALMRRRELLVRSALGAGRERIVRQSITESLLLAVLGGLLGITIAVIAVPLLTRLVPNSLPIAQQPTVDMRVLTFAAVLVVMTALFSGILPAWKSASSLDMSGMRDGARAGGGRRARARSVLVVVEVMASVVLLISAGLLMRALLKLENVDPGFRTENVLTLRTAPTVPKYDSLAARIPLYRDVLAGVRALPGVMAAAYTTGLPMEMTGGIWGVIPIGEQLQDARRNGSSSRQVTPGYFSVLGIPLKNGRDVAESDDVKQPFVAVVSESFVKKFFPTGDPIGRRFKFLRTERTIVGVVGDVRVRGVERPSEPQVYLSFKQDTNNSPFFMPKDMVVRSTVPAATLVPAIRQIVQRVDPEQPVSNVRMLSTVVADQIAARAVQVRVLSAFAAIAFLLAGVGIHGLLSYSVSTRQHEIGVRMALGAQRGQIVRMIMRHGAMLAAAGVIPGIAIAYVAARAMRTLLAGIDPGDLMTFSAAGAMCVVMTLIGTLLPTLRAVRVDPATAFRTEA